MRTPQIYQSEVPTLCKQITIPMISASRSHNHHGIQSYIIQLDLYKTYINGGHTTKSATIVTQDGINYDIAEAFG